MEDSINHAVAFVFCSDSVRFIDSGDSSISSTNRFHVYCRCILFVEKKKMAHPDDELTILNIGHSLTMVSEMYIPTYMKDLLYATHGRRRFGK